MEFQLIKSLFHIAPGMEREIGYSEEEIERCCETWGGLPLVLKEYYRQLGKHRELNYSQNMICEPDHLIDTGGYLIFYKENQYVAQWAIRKQDISLDNPPVYCGLDEKNFQLECENLFDFLCAMALFQATWGLSFSCEDIYMITEEQADQIRGHYKKKPYSLNQWIPIGFYGNHDDEVIYLGENDDYDMVYASADEAHYQAMDQFMASLNLESY